MGKLRFPCVASWLLAWNPGRCRIEERILGRSCTPPVALEDGAIGVNGEAIAAGGVVGVWYCFHRVAQCHVGAHHVDARSTRSGRTLFSQNREDVARLRGDSAGLSFGTRKCLVDQAQGIR